MPPSESTRRFDVIISGASFAGLALARALASALPDLRIAIVDRAAREGAAARPDARAFALSAGSRRMLASLGLWQRMAEAAQPVTEIEITDSSLEAGIRPVLLKYENEVLGTASAGDETREPASHILPAPVLDAALHEAVAATAGIALIAPAEIVSFADSGADMRVTLADGTTLSAPLLVGAEGRRSPSREEAGIKSIGWRYGQTAIVTTITHERQHNGTAVQHFLPAGPFAILPLPGNASCLTWTEDQGEARRILALDDVGFLAEVELRVGGRLGAVEIAGPRQSWPLELNLARAYAAPRFALVGDAAHGVHPIAGQGVNLAFRDVAALSEVLVEDLRIGLDIGSLETLARYERWRRFDSTMSAAAFDGLNRLFSNDWTLLRAARDFGLSLVDRMPAVKRRLVAEAAGLAGDLPRLFKGERL